MLSTFAERVRRLLPAGRFARGVALLTGGTALSQLIIIITTPLITRLYTPEDMGLGSSFLAILTIFGVAAALRYDYTVPLPKDDETALHLVVGALLSTLFVSLAAFGILLLCGDWIVARLNLHEMQPLLWFLPLGLLAMGIYQTLTYWTVRQREFHIIAQTRIHQSIGQIAVQVIIGVIHASGAGLVIGYIVGQSSGSRRMLQGLLHSHRPQLSQLTARGVRHALTRYHRFALYSAPSMILNSAGLRSAPLLMASLFGWHVSGLYSFADRLTSIPVALMSTTLGQAFLAEAAPLMHTDPPAVRRLFYKLSLRLLALGAGIGIPIIVLSPWVIGWVFGEQWHDAVIYVQWWGLVLILQMMVSPLPILGITEYVRVQLIWDTLRFIVTSGALIGVWWWRGDPIDAMAAYSIAMISMYLMLFGINVWVLRRL